VIDPHEFARVTAIFEWKGKRITQEICIEAESAVCFAPLSRDHDLPHNYAGWTQASDQLIARDVLARQAAQQLVSAVLLEIREADPVNGYVTAEKEPNKTQ